MWPLENKIVCCIGSSQKSPPKLVEGKAIPELINAFDQHVSVEKDRECAREFSHLIDIDASSWRVLDDVIMGGKSSSTMRVSGDMSSTAGSMWEGNLSFEGGGFCGVRSSIIEDGACTFGEGQPSTSGVSFLARSVVGQSPLRLKVTLKTNHTIGLGNEYAYQASFVLKCNKDEGEKGGSNPFTRIMIPWSSFIPVKKAMQISVVDRPQATSKSTSDSQLQLPYPLDPSTEPFSIVQFGFTYSHFELNGLLNRECKEGGFGIEFLGAICSYNDVTTTDMNGPRFLLVSSAGVERNALCGDDEEKRKTEIPIVRLNPGGVLNYKYAAEMALRNSNLSYTIIRPTGLVEIDENDGSDGSLRLQLSQGDALTGIVSRRDVAYCVAEALDSPSVLQKTFELRRMETNSASSSPSLSQPSTLFLSEAVMRSASFSQIFSPLVSDWDRIGEQAHKMNLQPLPAAAEPPPPPSEDTVKDILKQVETIQSSRSLST